MSGEKPFGVYKKIAQTMQEMGAVKKDATHFQKYKYQSAEAVVTALRGVMANIGLVMLSECIGSTDTGSEWLCEYRYTFVDTEDGSSHSLLWQQSTSYTMGDKFDDKAMGKNHTYAQKYFLMRTFLVSSEDDPDTDKNKTSDYQKSAPAKKNSKKQKTANWLGNEVAIQEVKAGLAELKLTHSEDEISNARSIIDPEMGIYATARKYLDAIESQINKKAS